MKNKQGCWDIGIQIWSIRETIATLTKLWGEDLVIRKALPLEYKSRQWFPSPEILKYILDKVCLQTPNRGDQFSPTMVGRRKCDKYRFITTVPSAKYLKIWVSENKYCLRTLSKLSIYSKRNTYRHPQTRNNSRIF